MSDRPHQEVSWDERHYDDGTDPALLDIIDVPLLCHQPAAYQSENWLLDAENYWRRAGRGALTDLAALVDNPATLWTNGFSTFHDHNNKVPLEQAAALDSSLYLIGVPEVRLSVFAPSAAFGNSKRRVQAAFSYQASHYALRVTDPLIETRYLALPDGQHRLGPCYLTVSLGEPFEGHCYKLVAALMPATEVR